MKIDDLQQRDSLIREMSAAGLSIRKISKVLDIGKSRVHQVITGYRADPTPEQKEGFRLAKYRLSRETYDALLAAQGCACAICRRPFDDKKPFIDHCHKSMAVRGLLCSNCNSGIGLLGDDPTIAANAAAYLKRAA